jgi:lipopolysaccharide export system protein LptA
VTWQKTVRLVVAAIGLGTAAAIYFLARPKPMPPAPKAAIAIEPGAKVQTGAGKNIRTEGDRTIGTYTFTAMRSYEGDKVQLDGFRYEFADGGFMQADRVQAQGSAGSNSAMPAEFTATGNVVFENRTGMTLHAQDVTFNDATGIAIMRGPVSFVRGKTSGTGTDAVYQQRTGGFTLQQDSHVVFAPDDASTAPVDITSRTMDYADEGRTLKFSGDARITRATELLVSTNTTLFLSEDQKTFTRIELRENAQVTPLPGKSSDLPEMRAQDIDLMFYPNGSALQSARLNQQAAMVMTNESGRRSIEGAIISFDTAADGKTLTRLEAQDRVIVKTPGSGATPERQISAARLLANGTAGQQQKGLTAARFEGNVEFLELIPAGNGKPEGRRKGTSRILLTKLDGQLDAIQSARFEQNVEFEDGDVSGKADVGIYDAAKGALELQPLPNSKLPAHVDSGSVQVDARGSIQINLNTTDIVATRDVNTVSVGQKDGKSGPETSAIFNSTDKLYGSGTEFRYFARGKRAVYRGTAQTPARLRQGSDSAVAATDITFSDQDQDLTAIGNVTTSFMMAPSATDTVQKRFTAQADDLHYVDARRTATYQGAPAVLSGADGETRANRIVLQLANESRTLTNLTATTNARMLLAEGRMVEAASVLYDAIKDLYTLEGRPLRLFARSSDGRCTIYEGSFATYSPAQGAPEFPLAMNPTTAPSKTGQPCPAAVPPVRPAAPATK